MTEDELNRTLRRLDWRFLLPLEDEPRTACFAGGRLGADVRRVFAVVDEPPWDLAVVADPSPGTLREATAGLRRGGALYAQWRLPTRAASARRRLHAAGFEHVDVYWPWPWHRGLPRFWYPLGATGDVLRERRASGKRLDVLQQAAVGAARNGLLPPLGAVTNPDRQLFLLTGGGHSLNKAIGVDTSDGRVVKFARTADRDEALLREHAILSLLQREHADLPGVPRPLELSRRCGRVALAESRVGGRPVAGGVPPSLAEQVVHWAATLAGRAAPQPRAGWWERLVEEPLRDFEREYAGVVTSTQLARARDVLEQLPDLPLVIEHRDLSPWNIVVDDAGGLGVLDWESSVAEGLPLLDVLYFVEHAGLADGGDACIELYRSLLGLPAAVVAPLRLLCWIVHAHSEHGRLAADERADGFFVRRVLAAVAVERGDAPGERRD